MIKRQLKKTIPLPVRDSKVVNMIQKGHQVHLTAKDKAKSRKGRYAEQSRKEIKDYLWKK